MEHFHFFCSHSVLPTKITYGNLFIFVFLESHSGWPYTTPIGTSYYVIYMYSVRVQCVCVCFCVSSHSFWTSSLLDVPAGVTGFFIRLLSAVRALIFLARRIQPFLSLVDREVEFCVLTISLFSTCWACFLRKILFIGIKLTSQRVRRLRGYF